MNKDLNTAQALAAVFDWVREVNTDITDGIVKADDRCLILGTLDKLNEVLVLWESEEDFLDPQIQKLIDQRIQARKSKDFILADKIRDEIFNRGYIVEDTREGMRWKKR